MDVRRVVLLHDGQRRTWRDLDQRMGNVEVRFHHHALLEGRGGLPNWFHRPHRPVRVTKRALVRARKVVVRQLLSQELAGGGHRRPVVIVTDQERLAPARAERIAEWMPFLEQHATVLNHPTRTLRRLALLELFASTGRNTFRAWRASDPRLDPRFPVFVRSEADHRGPSTDPLPDAAALRAALDRLLAAGRHPDGLLVVEKLDVPLMDAKTPKWSAVRIGDHVFPRHLFSSTNWVAKSSVSRPSAWMLDAEREFLASFPHEAEVRDRFDAAGITYGRIDYAMVNGHLETFEINTNPSWIKPGYFREGHPRRHVHELFRDRMRDAFDALP